MVGVLGVAAGVRRGVVGVPGVVGAVVGVVGVLEWRPSLKLWERFDLIIVFGLGFFGDLVWGFVVLFWFLGSFPTHF